MTIPKINRPPGPDGGDSLDVESGGAVNVRAGGTVKIFSAGAGGGKLTPSSGTQAAFTAAASTSTGAGTFATTAAENTAIQTIAKLANANAAALKGIGAVATSA